MSKALLAISADALLEAPFFVIDGPDGATACQWTAFQDGRARSNEFEILCAERPEKIGCLFGLFDPKNGEFRMRPEIAPFTFEAVADGCQDLAWRGDLNSVMDTGHDWEMGPEGRLVIADPEAPAEDPADAVGQTSSLLPLAA